MKLNLLTWTSTQTEDVLKLFGLIPIWSRFKRDNEAIQYEISPSKRDNATSEIDYKYLIDLRVRQFINLKGIVSVQELIDIFEVVSTSLLLEYDNYLETKYKKRYENKVQPILMHVISKRGI